METLLVVLGATLSVVAVVASFMLRKREALPDATDPWETFSPRTDAEVDARANPWPAVALLAGVAMVVVGLTTMSDKPSRSVGTLTSPIPLSAPAQEIDTIAATSEPSPSPSVAEAADGNAVSSPVVTKKPTASRAPGRGPGGSGGSGNPAPAVTPRPTPKPTPTPPPAPSIALSGRNCNGLEKKFNVSFTITAAPGTSLGSARITSNGTSVYSEQLSGSQQSRSFSGTWNGGSVVLTASSANGGRTASATICS